MAQDETIPQVGSDPAPNSISLLLLAMIEQYKARVAQLEAEIAVLQSRERKDYFAGCTTVAEVKARYLQYAYQHNFCSGGDKQTIQRINDQYDKACDTIVLDTATSEDGLVWQFERVALFKDVVALLLILPAVKVEVVDTCLCVTTSEFLVERELRQHGFRMVADKQAWCYQL